jgi:HEAT repeat protein
MFTRFFAWLFGRKTNSNVIILKREQIGHIVSKQCDADLRGEVAECASESIPTEELIATCERHWRRLDETPDYDKSALRSERIDRYNDYTRAVNALGGRGPVVRDWARRLLSHPDYDARETGAWLLGELGERGQLGDATGTVITELAALINRPFDEDPPKEATAIALAIAALAKIGDPRGLGVIRQVLFSKKLEHEGDTQWEAVYALEKLTGESFSESDNREEAARNWLQAHPNI